MHAREQEVSNALVETSTFVMHHLQVTPPPPPPPLPGSPLLLSQTTHNTDFVVVISAIAAAYCGVLAPSPLSCEGHLVCRLGVSSETGTV